MRSRRPIDASSRSRASASASAIAVRVRSSAIVASEASVCISGQVVRRERAIVVGRRDGDHGDDALVADERHERGALRPQSRASRELTRVEPATS